MKFEYGEKPSSTRHCSDAWGNKSVCCVKMVVCPAFVARIMLNELKHECPGQGIGFSGDYKRAARFKPLIAVSKYHQADIKIQLGSAE